MKIQTLIPLGLAVSAVIGVKSPGYFKVDYNVERGSNNIYSKRFKNVKRGFELTVENLETYYVADLKLGSDEQPLQVLLDTGSSDLWVMDSDVSCSAPSRSKRDDLESRGIKLDFDLDAKGQSSGRKVSPIAAAAEVHGQIKAVESAIAEEPDHSSPKGNGRTPCHALGSFDRSTSDTWRTNSSDDGFFYIAYADQTDAQGIWGYDDVTIQNTTVKGLSFAVANESSSDVAVCGIGLPELEMTYAYADQLGFTAHQYENLPLKLKSEGLIEKAAYSVYLNSSDSKKGSVLFGAVDHAKHKGPLEVFEMASGYESGRLQIVLDTITVEDDEQNTDTIGDFTVITVLDTGSTMTYLPTRYVTALADMLNLKYSSEYGAHFMNCKASGWSITYNFGNTAIRVPIEELVYDLRDEYGSCFFGIFENGGGNSILGDNFLRSAYVVYDLEDELIGLAPINYSTDEDIVQITGSIPTGGSSTSGGFNSSSVIGSSTPSSEGSLSSDLGENDPGFGAEDFGDDESDTDSSGGGGVSFGSGNHLQVSILTVAVALFIHLSQCSY